MKDYLKLLRIKHYVKNFLVFVPLFFAKGFFDVSVLAKAFYGTICFCLISSSVYIINDIQDVEQDRNHPKKKFRPIASGRIRIQNALILLGLCIATTIFISMTLLQSKGILALAIYFGINIAYSMGLKNKPIVDVIILASGFVIRIIYGGLITNVEISKWLYLVVITGSLYMGLGKRRNEMKHEQNTRSVLKYYTESFLDKNMYVFVSLVIVFYSLWTVESMNSLMVWTVPAIIIILMKYSFNIEGESDGDPVEVLLHDKILIILALLYGGGIFTLLYII